MQLKAVLDNFYHQFTLSELKLMNSSYSEFKISYNSLLYLDLIGSKNNCTVSYLADALRIAKPSVTQKINELETMGLLKREQSSVDKRVFFLALTPEVEKIYNNFDNSFINAIEEIEQKYDKKTIEDFCNIFEIFTRHLNLIQDNTDIK